MNTDSLENKWKLLLVKAKIVWTDLTDDDLKKAEAGVEKLVAIIAEKYGKTKNEAHKLVEDFLEKHKDHDAGKPKA
jgi:uncharacterized protein YjbJ (UPF0337 family)